MLLGIVVFFKFRCEVCGNIDNSGLSIQFYGNSYSIPNLPIGFLPDFLTDSDNMTACTHIHQGTSIRNVAKSGANGHPAFCSKIGFNIMGEFYICPATPPSTLYYRIK